MKRLLLLACGGLLLCLVGLGFVFPQVAAWRDQGTLPLLGFLLLPLGAALTLGGVSTACYGIQAYRK